MATGVQGCPFNYATEDSDSSSSQTYIPNEFTVSQNYPNPFNGTTSIMFTAPEKGDYSVIVYNILGQQTYYKEINNLDPGDHYLVISNSEIKNWASGVYFYNISYNNSSISKRMVLLK